MVKKISDILYKQVDKGGLLGYSAALRAYSDRILEFEKNNKIADLVVPAIADVITVLAKL